MNAVDLMILLARLGHDAVIYPADSIGKSEIVIFRDGGEEIRVTV